MSTATTARAAAERRIRLVGPGGEPVDLRRTLNSHGFVDLPPMRPDPTYDAVTVTIPIRSGRPRRIRIEPGPRKTARVSLLGGRVTERALDEAEATARHLLRLDEDLSSFYAVAADDPELAWVTSGAGRMVRSASVFEDVVKTICTTNCAWSATVRMMHALVRHLGEPAPGAPEDSAEGRAFPTPDAMASAGDAFYRDVVRAGYRGAYLARLARDVASGALDLEAFGRTSAEELPDDELEGALLAVSGVGPYAAAHIMMTLGRYHRLILDSWTRPTYARKVGRTTVSDAAIVKRFRRYGPYAGLAFWLFLTEDWVA